MSILFFILLPTLDVIIGKIYFNHLCKTQGGLKVYQNVRADGFLSKNSIASGDSRLHKKQGFSYFEGMKSFGYGKYQGKTMIQHLNIIDNNQALDTS